MPTRITPALICLLGGSFNPVHAGHFRIAIEAHEALEPHRTLFIPCASPPHKPRNNLLPFDLRASLVEAGLAELHAGNPHRPPRMEVCRIEGERSGPSYTVDTLEQLAHAEPDKRLCFILGGDDFCLLDTWRHWRRIAELADLAVLPRGRNGHDECVVALQRFWPEATHTTPPSPGVTAAFALPEGGRVLYLSQPRLEISSSLVRKRWVGGRSLDFLVPGGVQRLLHTHAAAVASLWSPEQAEHCRAVSPTG